MIWTSRRISSKSPRLMIFRVAMDLHANCSLVILWVTKYVTPNWPRPNSRPKVYVDRISSMGRPNTRPMVDVGVAVGVGWLGFRSGGGVEMGLECGGWDSELEIGSLLQFPIEYVENEILQWWCFSWCFFSSSKCFVVVLLRTKNRVFVWKSENETLIWWWRFKMDFGHLRRNTRGLTNAIHFTSFLNASNSFPVFFFLSTFTSHFLCWADN